MNDPLIVERELLERVQFELNNLEYLKFKGTGACNTAEDVRKLLAQPAPQEPVGEEVEVLGYFNPGELLQDAFRFEPDSGSVPVMAVAQCQRIVAGLKAENAKLLGDAAKYRRLLANAPNSVKYLSAAIDAAFAEADATKPCPHGSDDACKQCYMEETK